MARKKTTPQRSKPVARKNRIVEFISAGTAGGHFQVHLPPVWRQNLPFMQKRVRPAKGKRRKQR